MRRTKGQAAMEFLMTYGWAILAAIIVIGILGYYYFSSDVLTPKTSILNPPFYLSVATARTTGVNLEIKNNGGEAVTISSVNVTNCGGAVPSPATIANGESTIANIGCDLTGVNTFKGDITVYFTVSGTTLEQSVTGSMTQPVTA